MEGRGGGAERAEPRAVGEAETPSRPGQVRTRPGKALQAFGGGRAGWRPASLQPPGEGPAPGPGGKASWLKSPPVGSAGGGAAPGPGGQTPPSPPPSPGERGGGAPHLPPWRSSQGSPLGLGGGGSEGEVGIACKAISGLHRFPPCPSPVPESRGQRPSPGSLLRRRLSCSSLLASGLPFSPSQPRGI